MKAGLLVPLVILVACGEGDGGGTARPDAGRSADAAVTIADAAAPDAVVVPYCYPACTTPADCAADSVPYFSEDNFRCNDGACEYTGCLSDDECAPRACRKFYDMPANCEPRCTTPADCTSPEADRSEDNFECVDGAGKWLGCRSDAECIEDEGPGWVCIANREATIPGCWQVCDAAAGCDTGYTCINGFCEFACTSSEDCGPGEWVCR